MMIKAIVRDGQIFPTEPLPPEWREGQELRIEEPVPEQAESDLSAWQAELDASTAQIPAAQHEELSHAMSQVEHNSKELVRREWDLAR